MKYLKANSSFSARSPMATPDVSVVFDRAALEQAKYLVEEVSTECQWFHRVERIEEGNSITFYVYDIVVPDQEVSAAFVESSENEMVAMSDEIMNRLGGEDKVLESDELVDQFNELTNTFSVWCHSHVNMGTSPSGTDQTEFRDRIKNATDAGVVHPQIMFILNKKGDYTCHIADLNSGWVFKNPDIVVSNADIDFSYIDSAIKTKLRKKKPPVFIGNTKSSFVTSGVWQGTSRDVPHHFTGGTPQGNVLAALEAASMTDYLDGRTASLSFDPDNLVKLTAEEAEEIIRLCKCCDDTTKKSKREIYLKDLAKLVSHLVGIESMYYLNTLMFESYTLASNLKEEDFYIGTEMDLETFKDYVEELPFDHNMLVDIVDDILMIKDFPVSFAEEHKSMLQEYFYTGV